MNWLFVCKSPTQGVTLLFSNLPTITTFNLFMYYSVVFFPPLFIVTFKVVDVPQSELVPYPVSSCSVPFEWFMYWSPPVFISFEMQPVMLTRNQKVLCPKHFRNHTDSYKPLTLETPSVSIKQTTIYRKLHTSRLINYTISLLNIKRFFFSSPTDKAEQRIQQHYDLIDCSLVLIERRRLWPSWHKIFALFMNYDDFYQKHR